MTEGQSGGKDRQASFPTKRPLEKLVKKKKSAPARFQRCRLVSVLPMRILQALP